MRINHNEYLCFRNWRVPMQMLLFIIRTLSNILEPSEMRSDFWPLEFPHVSSLDFGRSLDVNNGSGSNHFPEYLIHDTHNLIMVCGCCILLQIEYWFGNEEIVLIWWLNKSSVLFCPVFGCCCILGHPSNN